MKIENENENENENEGKGYYEENTLRKQNRKVYLKLKKLLQ